MWNDERTRNSSDKDKKKSMILTTNRKNGYINAEYKR